MDKQKRIEETTKVIEEAMAKARRILGGHNNIAMFYAKMLVNADYRKIPENAVVLMNENEIKQYEWSKMLDKMGVFKFADMVRKETAEKFAERLKEIEEALLDMVVQFCQMGEEGKLKHAFMSAEEQAFDVLDIKYGEKVDKVYKRFNKKWNRPIDEIAKELTEG